MERGYPVALFRTPELGRQEKRVLEAIAVLRRKHGGDPGLHRWLGLLRRVMMARAVRGSNSIEGYEVSVDDALAAGVGEDPLEAKGETWRAVVGYQSAMTFVLQLSESDDWFGISADLVRSLHYMMIQYDLS